MRDRRQGIMTDTGHARRWNDKIFSFIFFILLVFLLNWILGCAGGKVGEEVSDLRRTTVDCAEPYFQDDFRCQVYLPEEDIELDQVETEAVFEVEF